MKKIRFDRLVLISLGLLLFVLLSVSGLAFFQARNTRSKLEQVLYYHVPILTKLLDSQSYLFSANQNFQTFYYTERIPPYRIIEPAERLKDILAKLDNLYSNGYSKKLINNSHVLVDKLISLTNQSNINGEQLEVINDEIDEIRHNSNLLAQQLSQADQIDSLTSYLKNVSDLLGVLEYELLRYMSQEVITFNQLKAPLQKCLDQIYAITELEGSDTFPQTQTQLLNTLSQSLEQYKSAMALYYDEHELDVSGANLKEILSQVNSYQQTAGRNFQLLRSNLIEYIDIIHKDIDRTAQAQQQMFIMVALVGGVIMIGASYVLKNVLSDRISQLVDGAESVASGDLSTRLEYGPEQDQLQRLVNAFNKMANSLESREQEIVQHQQKLARVQKMESVGKLAGGVAHEFNNILAIILGNNELVKMELPKSSPLREQVEDIQFAGVRAKEVIQQLVTFSRQDDLTQDLVDIREVILKSVKLIRSTTPSNIKITHKLADNIFQIKANETQINQLLINICNNATDALPHLGGEISIGLSNEMILENFPGEIQELSPGNYVKLTVGDNGTGMEPEVLSRMFEPYFTTKEIGKGTGIGLAVVHGIVQQHQGVISAQSEIGKGTTVFVYFPAVEGKVG
ncbi:MAG: sensor histidine kinase [Desulfobulbaceae bacterium]|nr:MAG: sensor histidine kinase [Desulfobulbaceae bacterium]